MVWQISWTGVALLNGILELLGMTKTFYFLNILQLLAPIGNIALMGVILALQITTPAALINPVLGTTNTNDYLAILTNIGASFE